MECTKGKILRVLSSAAGYYIGTLDEEGFPFCRASEEYYTLREEATAVLELLKFTERSCIENQLCSGHKGCLKKTESDDMEFTDEQLARLDEIDNTVFDCIRALAEKPDMEWDMQVIGNVTDAIKSTLSEFGLSVRHPGFIHHKDGRTEYAE